MIGPIICAGLFPLPHEGLPIPQLRAVLELGLAGLQRMMLWSKELGWPAGSSREPFSSARDLLGSGLRQSQRMPLPPCQCPRTI